MTNRLTARRLITADATVEFPAITVDGDGAISKIESDPQSLARDETTLTPAFFDVHVHGAAGHDVMEGTSQAFNRIGAYLATRGVGHFLATTVTAPVDPTLRALEGIANAIDAAERGDTACAARPVGIHLEGPFISHAKRGVHPPADIQPPSIPLFERMRQAARGHILLMTIAPEMPGALDLIEYATGAGTYVSLGHSDATAGQTRAALAAGAVSATHTFNAMRALDHREPGILGTVLTNDDLFAELICDGIHIAPEIVKLWWSAKGAQRAILVTDAMSATGMPDGEYFLGGFPVHVANGRAMSGGVLAGSVLTLDRALANFITFTGAPLVQSLRLLTVNPASMTGLADQAGSITVGRPANLVAISAEGNLLASFMQGKQA